jgi:hypothetical protein
MAEHPRFYPRMTGVTIPHYYSLSLITPAIVQVPDAAEMT